MKKILIKHVGNMGDMVFLVPPALTTLKKIYPQSQITFITAWGYKDKKGRWGQRSLGGHCLALSMTNPHIDHLIHWHDTKLSLSKNICQEEGHKFPTWSQPYYEQIKQSPDYDLDYELDFGINTQDNPIKKMYELMDIPDENFSNYQLYFSDQDLAIAQKVISSVPRPRLVLLESLLGATTRSWDPNKAPALHEKIKQQFKVEPLYFGSRFVPHYQGAPLTLRQNIALLKFCDVAIGTMSGPLHFAAACGLPTITLYCDAPLHRAAPAYFLNKYIDDKQSKHRTIIGPSPTPYRQLKNPLTCDNLTPQEISQQVYKSWSEPGQSSKKSCLAVITVDEIMSVLSDMIN
jgi:hypothetical protein